MNPLIYYSVTIGLYSLEVLLAILINNIAMVFGFIATFAGTGLSFFIPSLLVIIGFKKFADAKFMQENKIWVTIAWINFCAGVFFFILFLINNILGLVYAESAPPPGTPPACGANQYHGIPRPR